MRPGLMNLGQPPCFIYIAGKESIGGHCESEGVPEMDESNIKMEPRIPYTVSNFRDRAHFPEHGKGLNLGSFVAYKTDSPVGLAYPKPPAGSSYVTHIVLSAKDFGVTVSVELLRVIFDHTDVVCG